MGQIIVVFYRLERCWFAEKTKVMDWDWVWEDSLDSCGLGQSEHGNVGSGICVA